MATPRQNTPRLIPGRTYTWSELGARFDFKPRYLSVAGGMMPRPQLDALLLVTWPGGARSFNYDDYWSRGDLIYTGRGKRGNQKLEGANRDLANNRYTNYVFEGGVGSEKLRFLGTATATRQWRARGIAAEYDGSYTTGRSGLRRSLAHDWRAPLNLQGFCGRYRLGKPGAWLELERPRRRGVEPARDFSRGDEHAAAVRAREGAA